MKMKKRLVVLACLGCASQTFGMHIEGHLDGPHLGDGTNLPRVDQSVNETREQRLERERQNQQKNGSTATDHAASSARVPVKPAGGSGISADGPGSPLNAQVVDPGSADVDSETARDLQAIKDVYGKNPISFYSRWKKHFQKKGPFDSQKFNETISKKVTSIINEITVALKEEPYLFHDDNKDFSNPDIIRNELLSKKREIDDALEKSNSFAGRKVVFELLRKLEVLKRQRISVIRNEEKRAQRLRVKDSRDSSSQFQKSLLKPAKEEDRSKQLEQARSKQEEARKKKETDESEKKEMEEKAKQVEQEEKMKRFKELVGPDFGTADSAVTAKPNSQAKGQAEIAKKTTKELVEQVRAEWSGYKDLSWDEQKQARLERDEENIRRELKDVSFEELREEYKDRLTLLPSYYRTEKEFNDSPMTKDRVLESMINEQALTEAEKVTPVTWQMVETLRKAQHVPNS